MYPFFQVHAFLKTKFVLLSILCSVTFFSGFTQTKGLFDLVKATRVHVDESIDEYEFDSIPIKLYLKNPTLEFNDGIITICDSSQKILVTNDEMKQFVVENEIHYVWSECLQEDGSFQDILYITRTNARIHVIMIIDNETNSGVAYTIKERVNEADYARKRFNFPFLK